MTNASGSGLYSDVSKTLVYAKGGGVLKIARGRTGASQDLGGVKYCKASRRPPRSKSCGIWASGDHGCIAVEGLGPRSPWNEGGRKWLRTLLRSAKLRRVASGQGRKRKQWATQSSGNEDGRKQPCTLAWCETSQRWQSGFRKYCAQVAKAARAWRGQKRKRWATQSPGNELRLHTHGEVENSYTKPREWVVENCRACFGAARNFAEVATGAENKRMGDIILLATTTPKPPRKYLHAIITLGKIQETPPSLNNAPPGRLFASAQFQNASGADSVFSWRVCRVHQETVRVFAIMTIPVSARYQGTKLPAHFHSGVEKV
ncbi:hypothetical protein EDB86DRAFT_2825955 [Lactarius hatsudake]|nr:hypothetical protein EDB86DRAFT_2825955 [Lactarius hatsudake]